MSKQILIVIDDIELKFFEFNDLVTDFWLIKEYLERGYKVSVCLKKGLFVFQNRGCAITYETYLKDDNIFYNKDSQRRSINDFDTVYFRPDPPVDINYINACYIFDFTDETKTKVINNPRSILDFNEKMHGNLFPKYTPENIITADNELIKEFTVQHGEAIIKPLNRCFGSGIYYLNADDKNLNSIITDSTDSGNTAVCVQEYLGHGEGGDKRAFIIGTRVFDFSLRKLPGKNDFRFNTHSDEFFKKDFLTEREKAAAIEIAQYLNDKELYTAALDIIDEKITEINVTSPCYFIREVNRLHGIRFQDEIMNLLINITESRV